MQSIRRRHRAWSVCRLFLAGFLLISTSGLVRGDSQLEDLATRAGFKILARGDSSSNRQKAARDNIPLNRMSPASRERASRILQNCNQYRSLPELQYSADPAMYRYLLQHPDVAVSTWRVMGISKFQMWQTGPTEYEAEAIDGSQGIADVLYRDDQQIIFICDGQYHNPLLPKSLDAAALVWFRYNFTPAADGQQLVSQKADVFVAFPSHSLSTVAKILTPVTNSMMDRNVFEVSLYAGMMSRAVRDEPEWVIQVARQLEGVLPQRENELIEIARLPRAPRVERPTSAQGGDRSMLLSSGISLFEPPKPEEVVAGMAKVSDVPQPAAVAKPSSAPTAPAAPSPAQQSTTKAPVKTVSQPNITNTSPPAEVVVTPAVRVADKPSDSTPAGTGDFRLQPEATPPQNLRKQK